MSQQTRLARLRDSGLTPTIQRVAVLDCLERTRTHPTADQVLVAVREQFPSISRATVYNTLEALTQAGLILRITVDPSVARYDADLGPHMHFRCRLCSTVYDIEVDGALDPTVRIEGHHVESVRTYAYGTCKECLAKDRSLRGPKGFSNEPTMEPGVASSKLAQRSPEGFSNEPTKEVRNA